jgi:uncharacterized protein YbjT (DUF2867 family)
MQNFSESFLAPVDGVITMPTADGTEAFVHADDIAAVAAETLADSAAHAGAAYAPTGPEAITVGEVAEIISAAAERPVRHDAVDADAWTSGNIAAGVPVEYAALLRMLTDTIAAGSGSRPNDDVRTVTGVAPTAFRDFAARTAVAWTNRP